jgi:hypothetical protein
MDREPSTMLMEVSMRGNETKANTKSQLLIARTSYFIAYPALAPRRLALLVMNPYEFY